MKFFTFLAALMMSVMQMAAEQSSDATLESIRRDLDELIRGQIEVRDLKALKAML